MGQKENYGEQLKTTYQTIQFDYSNFVIHFITFRHEGRKGLVKMAHF